MTTTYCATGVKRISPIFIVALPHALIMQPDQKTLDQKALASGLKKCPNCGEMIREEARVCRYHAYPVVTQD